MKQKFSVFLIKVSIFTIIIYCFYLLVKGYVPQKFHFENTNYLFVFFFLITCLFHCGLLFTFSKSNRSFVSYYMIATALKLFLYLAVIILYAFYNSDNAIAFICNFFAIYILFTAFEVSVVYSHFKSKLPVSVNENGAKTN